MTAGEAVHLEVKLNLFHRLGYVGESRVKRLADFDPWKCQEDRRMVSQSSPEGFGRVPGREVSFSLRAGITKLRAA